MNQLHSHHPAPDAGLEMMDLERLLMEALVRHADTRERQVDVLLALAKLCGTSGNALPQRLADARSEGLVPTVRDCSPAAIKKAAQEPLDIIEETVHQYRNS